MPNNDYANIYSSAVHSVRFTNTLSEHVKSIQNNVGIEECIDCNSIKMLIKW